MTNRLFPSTSRPCGAAHLLSAALLVIGAATTAHAAEPKPAPVALAVNAAVVKTERVARTLPVTGSIQAWQEIIIGPEVGGYRVDSVLVEVGDRVKRDQELVRLSTQATPTIVPGQTVRVCAKAGCARWYDADGHLVK